MAWNPLQDLMVLQDRMNRLFEDANQRRAQDKEDELERADWTPPADVYETETEFTIKTDIPGIDRNALEITLDENRLIVRGTREVKAPNGGRSERPSGTFLRRFSVPRSVEQDSISADYKDGVLEVHLPKRKNGKGQRVEIKVG
jgi:HSP20 family protein